MNVCQNTCFKERSNVAVEKNFRVQTRTKKDHIFQLSHGMKNIHRSKLYQ